MADWSEGTEQAAVGIRGFEERILELFCNMPSVYKPGASCGARAPPVGYPSPNGYPYVEGPGDGRFGWYAVSPSCYPPVATAYPCRVRPGGDGKARGLGRGRGSRDEFEKPASLLKVEEASRKLGTQGAPAWMNSQGFPLRSAKPDCKHYMTKSWCAYGAMCKFNHPEQAPLPGLMAAPGVGGMIPPPGQWGVVAPPCYWTPWGGVMAPGFMPYYQPHPEFMFGRSSVDSSLSSMLNLQRVDSDKGSDGGLDPADFPN